MEMINSRHSVRSVTGAACVNPSGLRLKQMDRLAGPLAIVLLLHPSRRVNADYSAHVIEDDSKALSSLVAGESKYEVARSVCCFFEDYRNH